MESMYEELIRLGVNIDSAKKLASLALEMASGKKNISRLWESVDSLTEVMDVEVKDQVEECIYKLLNKINEERDIKKRYCESVRALAYFLKPCPRCGGVGKVDFHYDDGLCFRCNGPGFFFNDRRLIPDSACELFDRKCFEKYEWGGPSMESDLTPYRNFIVAEMSRICLWTPPWEIVEGESQARDEILEILGSSLGVATERKSPVIVAHINSEIKESNPERVDDVRSLRDPLPVLGPKEELVSLGATAEQAEKALNLARESVFNSEKAYEFREIVNALSDTMPTEAKDQAEGVIAKEKFLAALRNKR